MFEKNAFQVPNAVVDSLLALLSGNEVKIYLTIIRKTKGWQKKEDAISISQFMALTNLSNKTVIDSCKSLEKKGLIESKMGSRGIKVYTCKKDTLEKNTQVNIPHDQNEEITQTKSSSKTINSSCNNTNCLSDEIKSIPLTQSTPALNLNVFSEQPSLSVWQDFILYRKNHHFMLNQTTLNQLAQQINLANQAGFTTDQILTLIQEKGWRRFEHHWLIKSPRSRTTPRSAQPVDWNSIGWSKGQVL